MAEDSRRLAAEDPPVLFLPRNYSRVSTQEPTAEESSQRRLEDLQFDVIAEGQASTFDLQWAKDVVGIAAIEASCLALLLSTAI